MPMKLDFSEFHPLDHTLFGCRGYPGGWRQHVAYRWDFQWRDAVRGRTWCRVGRHEFHVWRRVSLEGPGRFDGEVLDVVCSGCGRKADPAQRSEALVDDRERSARWEARRRAG